MRKSQLRIVLVARLIFTGEKNEAPAWIETELTKKIHIYKNIYDIIITVLLCSMDGALMCVNIQYMYM